MVTLTIGVLLAVIVVALLLGMYLGQPVLLSYVESDSMEPTIDRHDGFIAVPSELVADIGMDDVVVFESSDGALTTHRIVGETDRGFITRGDANPFTDQDAGETPVQEAQIVAVAYELGGSVVTIPHLGTGVEGVQASVRWVQMTVSSVFGTRLFLGAQGLLLLLFALSMLAYAIDVVVSDPRDAKRTRRVKRSSGIPVRTVLIVLALVVMVAATAAMVVPAGNHEFPMISSEFESDRPDIIQQGTSDDIEMPVSNDAGWIPVHAYIEPASDGVAVDPEYAYVPARSENEVTVTFTMPDETGLMRMFVVEHRYLAVLPKGVIDILYAAHPWFPLIAINAILGGGVYVVGRLLVGDPSTRIRTRDRRRHRSTSRLRRYLPL
ncbi:MAG: signal peptidase I [Halobacteriota archaeon]